MRSIRSSRTSRKRLSASTIAFAIAAAARRMDCRLSGHLAKAVCSKLNSGKLNTAHFKHSMPVLGEGLLDSRNLSRDCDPVCSDHDSPADDREAQAHEEVRMPDC